MVMDPANGSESASDLSQQSENLLNRAWSEVTRRTSRLILGSAEATSGLDSLAYEEADGAQVTVIPCAAEVTRRTPSPITILPPPSFISTRQAPLPPATESQSVIEDDGAEVTRGTPSVTMPILPPPVYPSRERIPCLRCKENRIDCHGPEMEYFGDCSKCHKAGRRCEFEAHVPATPSSLPNPQSSAENDGMPHPTASTNNDDRTHIDIPHSQLDTSLSWQWYQNPPINDPSRVREISNKIGGITSNNSISDEPRIKPWWKRKLSRMFSSRQVGGAKRKRRS